MNNNKIQITKEDERIIKKYNELDIKSTFMINKDEEYKHRIIQMTYQYRKIREEILAINNNVIHVTDVLIEYLYFNKKSNKKVTLWECFGDVILENLKKNLTKGFKKEAIECEGCGILIEKTSSSTKYCPECAKEVEKQNWAKRKRKQREKENVTK